MWVFSSFFMICLLLSSQQRLTGYLLIASFTFSTVTSVGIIECQPQHENKNRFYFAEQLADDLKRFAKGLLLCANRPSLDVAEGWLPSAKPVSV